MKGYIRPELMVSRFDSENIITTSAPPQGITAAEQGNEVMFGVFKVNAAKTIEIGEILNFSNQ